MSRPQTFSHWPAWPLPVYREVEVTAKHPCGYLPGRASTFRMFDAEELDAGEFQRWMDAGFRRSGTVIYQPMCAGCRECVPIRVPVEGFRASRSQRRVLRRNGDLLVTVGVPRATPEKWKLYDRYQSEWHDGKQAGDSEGFINFLYRSPVDTLEFVYRDGRTGDVLGVGICDLCPESLSSVYFYFDPRQKDRSLGTFSALYELQWARKRQIPHWYAGYYIAGCGQMSYKARFQPCELLGTDGVWRVMGTESTEGTSDAEPQGPGILGRSSE